MRAEKNHARFFAGNSHQNVFHRKAADGRVSAKGIRLDVAAIALQFGLQIILQMGDGGGAEATALMNGWLASRDDSLPLALQPVRPAGRMQRTAAVLRRFFVDKII